MEQTSKIDNKVRTVGARRSSQELISMGVTDTASSSASVPADDSVTFTVTTEHEEGLRVFAIEHFSVYQGTVSGVNKIPIGDNISRGDYEMVSWYDWGETDNKNIKFLIWVNNKTGSTQTILLRVNSRFIVEATTNN